MYEIGNDTAIVELVFRNQSNITLDDSNTTFMVDDMYSFHLLHGNDVEAFEVWSVLEIIIDSHDTNLTATILLDISPGKAASAFNPICLFTIVTNTDTLVLRLRSELVCLAGLEPHSPGRSWRRQLLTHRSP